MTGTIAAMLEGHLCHEAGSHTVDGNALGFENEDWLTAGEAAPAVETAWLDQTSAVASITRHAMGALGLCIVVVDVRLRVLYASPASRAHAARPQACFLMKSRGCGRAVYLSLGRRDDTLELRRQIAAAMAVEPVGRASANPCRFHSLYDSRSICLVSPIAGGAVDPRLSARFENSALLIFKPFASLPKPPPALLRSLFRFTAAEAEVASDLIGGISAEDVARRRAVRLDTVRSQIRSILSKSGAPNLRAFENRIGGLMSILPPD
jgi:DNA-binding CsgD family transcriptional regulator